MLEREVLRYRRIVSSLLMESEFLSVMKREGLLDDAHERLQRIAWILRLIPVLPVYLIAMLVFFS
jgi:hypothetical protein